MNELSSPSSSLNNQNGNEWRDQNNDKQTMKIDESTQSIELLCKRAKTGKKIYRFDNASVKCKTKHLEMVCMERRKKKKRRIKTSERINDHQVRHEKSQSYANSLPINYRRHLSWYYAWQ